MKTWELMCHTTAEKVVNYLLWEVEKHCDLLLQHPETFPSRKLKFIIDINNMVWGQLTTDLVTILKGFSDVSKDHHPQRLKTLYIIHAPGLFSLAWRVITPFIPIGTRNKIKILSSYEVERDPYMQFWLSKIPSSSKSPADEVPVSIPRKKRW